MQRSKFVIISWDDVHTKEYDQDVQHLWHVYNNNPAFRGIIEAHALEFMRYRKAQLTITPERLHAAVSYILTELPALHTGTA